MKVKVSEASGPVLDWMVAKAMGYKPRAFTEKDCGQSAVRPLTRWCGVDVTPGGHTIYFNHDEAQAAIDADPELSPHRHVVRLIAVMPEELL